MSAPGIFLVLSGSLLLAASFLLVGAYSWRRTSSLSVVGPNATAVASAVAAGAAALTLVVGFGLVPLLRGNSSSPLATITSPQAGAVVSENGFELTGEVTNLPTSSFVWAAGLARRSGATYQPLDHPCVVSTTVDGLADRFDCGNFFVGGPQDSGNSFTVFVMTANSDAAQDFLNYNASDPAAAGYPGLTALPSGTRILDEVEVVRQ